MGAEKTGHKVPALWATTDTPKQTKRVRQLFPTSLIPMNQGEHGETAAGPRMVVHDQTVADTTVTAVSLGARPLWEQRNGQNRNWIDPTDAPDQIGKIIGDPWGVEARTAACLIKSPMNPRAMPWSTWEEDPTHGHDPSEYATAVTGSWHLVTIVGREGMTIAKWDRDAEPEKDQGQAELLRGPLPEGQAELLRGLPGNGGMEKGEVPEGHARTPLAAEDGRRDV